MGRLEGRFGKAGGETVAVMSALAILSRLHTCRQEIAALKSRVAALEKDRAAVAIAREQDDAALASAIDEAAETIERHAADIIREINAGGRTARACVDCQTHDV